MSEGYAISSENLDKRNKLNKDIFFSTFAVEAAMRNASERLNILTNNLWEKYEAQGEDEVLSMRYEEIVEVETIIQNARIIMNKLHKNIQTYKGK